MMTTLCLYNYACAWPEVRAWYSQLCPYFLHGSHPESRYWDLCLYAIRLIKIYGLGLLAAFRIKTVCKIVGHVNVTVLSVL